MAFGEHCDRWFVNGAMACETPVRIQYVARETFAAKAKKALTLEVLHRCRKCKSCERMRSRMWAARAAKEFDQAARTWFGTLTMAPAHHAQIDAWVAAANLWPNRSGLTDEQFKVALFRARASVMGEQVSTWLNILRDSAFLRLHKREVIRYLLVAEKHDSSRTADFMRGRPHFHLILHEAVVGAVFAENEIVLKRERTGDVWTPFLFAADEAFARRAWPLGHTKFKYCETARAAHYICNYLYESDMTRMRASLHYGKRELPEIRKVTPRSGVVSAWADARAGTEEVDPPIRAEDSLAYG